MGLMLAFRSFFKALRDREGAERFIKGEDSSKKKDKKGTTGSSYVHLRLLSLLQQKGRLIDFMKEDVSDCSDAQLGAVAREIHKSCSGALEDLVSPRPIFADGEDAEVHIPRGYDPSRIKIVGNVKGEGPYIGKLVHPGWEAHKLSLPKQVGEMADEVLCPAEVEVT